MLRTGTCSWSSASPSPTGCFLFTARVHWEGAFGSICPLRGGGGNPEREWPKCIVHCTEDVTKRPS